MKTSGTFFLRGAPARFIVRAGDAAGGHAWRLSLGEREPGGGAFAFSATWQGQDADRFMAQHAGLKAGDCLDLALVRPRARGDELVWRIEHAAVAPPRWPAAAATRCAAVETAHQPRSPHPSIGHPAAA